MSNIYIFLKKEIVSDGNGFSENVVLDSFNPIRSKGGGVILAPRPLAGSLAKTSHLNLSDFS